jgi:hypothetical protein
MTNIYTIRDDAAQYFLPLFTALTDAEAKRMFILSLGPSFPHRSDFKLYHIGAYDDDNGLITSSDPRLVLAGMSISADLNPTPSAPSAPSPETMETTS